MTDSSQSNVITSLGMAVASPYITSDSLGTSWGQPSLSHFIVVFEGATIRGHLIEGIYPTAINSQFDAAITLAELKTELDAWDAAADEDFLASESKLE